MSVDPDSTSERSRQVGRTKLKMNDKETLQDTANVSDDIIKML